MQQPHNAQPQIFASYRAMGAFRPVARRETPNRMTCMASLWQSGFLERDSASKFRERPGPLQTQHWQGLHHVRLHLQSTCPPSWVGHLYSNPHTCVPSTSRRNVSFHSTWPRTPRSPTYPGTAWWGARTLRHEQCVAVETRASCGGLSTLLRGKRVEGSGGGESSAAPKTPDLGQASQRPRQSRLHALGGRAGGRGVGDASKCVGEGASGLSAPDV